MSKFKKFLIGFALLFPAMYVTTLGFDMIITYFHGRSIGMWDTYFLTFAFGLLRMQHSRKEETFLDRDIKGIVQISITALITDSVAVFLILPNVLDK